MLIGALRRGEGGAEESDELEELPDGWWKGREEAAVTAEE